MVSVNPLLLMMILVLLQHYVVLRPGKRTGEFTKPANAEFPVNDFARDTVNDLVKGVVKVTDYPATELFSLVVAS